jgi:DNA-binding NarL/FixJ family response regulator
MKTCRSGIIRRMTTPMQSTPVSAPHWRILIVDDHPIVRMGLAALIDAEPDMRVCGQAEDFHEALRAIAKLSPDLVLIDLSLRESSGLELLKETTRRAIRAIVVSMHETPTWAERALAAGARGYVQKSEAGRNVVQAIRKVRAGRLYVSESISEALLERRLNGGEMDERVDDRIAMLTDRELEVLQRIGNGLTTQQIGQELRVSPKTVQTYRERIKRKLALDSAAELSSEATRWVLEHSEMASAGSVAAP